MRRTRSQRTAPWRERVLTAPATVVALWVVVTLSVTAAGMLAGCSGPAAGQPLPVTSLAAGPSAPASPAPLPARQQVINALTGYTMALGAADKSRSPAQARSLLQPYLAASRIDGMVQTMSSIWAKGEAFYGQDVLHVLSVTVRGTVAVVHDCDDTSAMGLEVAASGELVQGSAGVPDENIVTTLHLTAGRWLVQFQLIEDVPCTA